MARRRPVHAVVDDLRRRDLLELVEEIAARRGVLMNPLCGTARTRSVARARHEAWWRMRHHPERAYSFFEIGRLFGRHHTTIIAGVEVHARRLGHSAVITSSATH